MPKATAHLELLTLKLLEYATGYRHRKRNTVKPKPGANLTVSRMRPVLSKSPMRPSLKPSRTFIPDWTAVASMLSSRVQLIVTRLHSSRMHTARLLTVSPSMRCSGGCLLRGVSAPGGVCCGGTWSGECLVLRGCLLWGASALRDAWSGGCLVPGVSALGDVCSQGGVCSGGCLVQGGAWS